ncbi:MAG: type II toxin-antitoxin system RelE/ParE family toxin [Gemmataceae bacterium]
MQYEVILKPSAAKQLDKPIRARIIDALEKLRRNPRGHGAVKLKGEESLWRIRVGDYRIVFEIEDDRLIVLVLCIAHRKDAYKGM